MFKKIKNSLIPKTSKEPKVLIVRHGTTTYNNEDKSQDRIRGWLDIPLNEQGIEEAKEAGAKLKKDKIKTFYCSDLIRAKQTCQEIQSYHKKCPVIYMNQLRPWNLGQYHGLKTADILNDLNQMIIDENIRPKDGETFKEFRVRFLCELEKIMNQAKKENSEIVIVSHFRNLKCADAWIKNGCPSDYSIDKLGMIKDEFKPGTIYNLKLKEESK